MNKIDRSVSGGIVYGRTDMTKAADVAELRYRGKTFDQRR